MNSAGTVPAVRDLVLVGGGHSHIQVLKRLAMHPLPGVRTTVVAREVHTPYSGMLPGYIAGHYGYDDAHIDLGPLALAAGARLIAGEAVALDLSNRRVEIDKHPGLRYDVVSLNCGAAPGFSRIDERGDAIPVKPIGRFVPRWNELCDAVARADAAQPKRVVIVGGGAGGVELALAARHALRGMAALLVLVTANDALLVGHSRRVQRRFDALLHERGVEVVKSFEVASVDARGVVDRAGRAVAADFVLWVAAVEPPAWIRDSGLAVDAGGFVAVDRSLRSVSDPRVFATGDVAAMVDQPRPKSGVFAVRQGPVLADNLRRALLGERLRRYRAQRRALALISHGDRAATASRGDWYADGPWVWRWKDAIDRGFMRGFREVPMPQQPRREIAPRLAAEVPDAMRCGGCGAKLGADLLARVLDRLEIAPAQRVSIGVGDDAAELAVGGSRVMLSVDSLRTMLDDPYEFGRIAARHALNDIHAMGCVPVAALALPTIPLMGPAQMEEDLLLVMRGAADVLREEGVALAGGHSSEGVELALGFAVAGDVIDPPLRKRGLAVGDALVLTRPIGSGVLFAARARGLARSRWVRDALREMDASNASAARLLRQFGAVACTDVTGFGLLGHLGEMQRASNVGVEIDVEAVPMYDGAAAMVAAGVASSLQANNELALHDFDFVRCSMTSDVVRLLVDPQTAGGLLAGIPQERAVACVAALREAGYARAAVIGRVVAACDRAGTVRSGSNA